MVRLLARRGAGNLSRRLTHHDIAEISGLSYAKVRSLSGMNDWSTVTIGDADAFMHACGVTLKNLWRQRFFLRRSPDPRKTSKPLAYASRKGRAQAPPTPAALVEAALSSGRSRP